MVLIQLLTIIALAVSTIGGGLEAKRNRINQEVYSPWKKITDKHEVICFEGKGGKHGTLVYSGRSGMVFAMKLVHKSGHIKCAPGAGYKSFWGCQHFPGLERFPLNTIVTDDSNHIIYPHSEYLHDSNIFFKQALWYYLPATDALHSKELIFANYGRPFYLRNKATLRFWYGEDLTNRFERDNSGKVCFNVYAQMMHYF